MKIIDFYYALAKINLIVANIVPLSKGAHWRSLTYVVHDYAMFLFMLKSIEECVILVFNNLSYHTNDISWSSTKEDYVVYPSKLKSDRLLKKFPCSNDVPKMFI